MTPEQREKLARIGQEIYTQLKKQFQDWGMGLPFKLVLSSRNYDAKRLGLTVSQLGMALEHLGFIRIISTMAGARHVFTHDCPLNANEMLSAIMEQDENRKLLKRKLEDSFND